MGFIVAKRYKIFGTTADVGVESWGDSLSEAFEAQAEGMFDVIAELPGVRPAEDFEIEAEGDDDETLLVAFLNELLFLFDAGGVLFREFKVSEIRGGRLKAAARGEKIDTSRHVIKTPVKAVTYHMIKVEKTKKGYRTKVVYDI